MDFSVVRDNNETKHYLFNLGKKSEQNKCKTNRIIRDVYLGSDFKEFNIVTSTINVEHIKNAVSFDCSDIVKESKALMP